MTKIEEIKAEIIACIDKYIINHRNELSKEEYYEIRKNQLELKRANIKTFEELKKSEIKFQKYFNRLWVKSLTIFREFDGRSPFKFIISCPTVRAENYKDTLSISSTLISNQFMGTFSNIPYGVVYEIEEDSIVAINDQDMHSVAISSDSTDFRASYYYLSSIASQEFYAKSYINSLKTPGEIEASMIMQNLNHNKGDVRGAKSIYSDILLDGTKAKRVGVILITPCDESYTIEANKLANKLNVPLQEIDSIYYNNKQRQTMVAKQYDLNNIDTVLEIVSNINYYQNEPNNLIIEKSSCYYRIKSQDSSNYIYYNEYINQIEFIIDGDSSSIIINQGPRIEFILNDKIVENKETIQQYIKDKSLATKEKGL